VISEAKFFAIVFSGNSPRLSRIGNHALCHVPGITTRFLAFERIALPVQQPAPRKNTGVKKHDTQSAVQQSNNRLSKKKSPAEPGFF